MIPKINIGIFFIACLAFLSGCSLIWPDYLPYRFEVSQSIFKTESQEYCFADFDGDGCFEIVTYNSRALSTQPSPICYYDGNLSAGFVWQENDTLPHQNLFAVFSEPEAGASNSGFPKKNIMITQKGDSRLYIKLRDSRDGHLIWQKEIFRGEDLNDDGIWDADFKFQLNHDLNGDGLDEVLLIGYAGFDLFPRGFWAIDPSNGNVLWKFETGPMPSTPFFCDLNNDGKEELIFGSISPANGAKINGTDDYHSYLFVLNPATGEPLWVKEMGAKYSQTLMTVIEDENGLPLIITGTSSSARGNEFTRIRYLQGLPPQQIRQVSLRISISALLAYDYDGDGFDEVVAYQYGGTLIVLDNQGKEIARVKDEPQSLSGVGMEVQFIPSPINQEVLITIHSDKTAKGYGKGLKPLFQLTHSNRLLTLEPPRLVQVSTKRLDFGQFVRAPLPIPYREIYFFLFGALAVVLSSLIITSFRMPLKWKLFKGDFPVGMIWLNRKGKIKRANRTAKSLVEDIPAQLPPEIQNALTEMRDKKLDLVTKEIRRGSGVDEKHLHATLLALSQGTLVTVADTTVAQMAHFLRQWGNAAGRTVHAIKTPANAISKQAEMLITGRYNKERARNIAEMSRLLLGYVDKFKEIFSLMELDLEEVELNQLVRRELIHYQGLYGKQIQFQVSLSEEKLLIRGDRNQLITLLHCLLDNAVEALETSGKIQIITQRLETIETEGSEWVQAWAELVISDNGPGMSEEAIQEALRWGKSRKKKGMGFGLPQAKLIAELHKGEFDIRSQPGIGTTVTIRLPLI